MELRVGSAVQVAQTSEILRYTLNVQTVNRNLYAG